VLGGKGDLLLLLTGFVCGSMVLLSLCVLLGLVSGLDGRVT
jgi:hypothetical protein